MQNPTINAVRAILLADPPESDAERRELASVCGIMTSPEALPRVITHDQTAELLSIGKRSLTNYVRRGWLRPFRPHGQRRALGFLESDVRAFLAPGVPSSSRETVASKGSGETREKTQ